jgi:cytoskeletal protein CcmA (bactofilin family)
MFYKKSAPPEAQKAEVKPAEAPQPAAGDLLTRSSESAAPAEPAKAATPAFKLPEAPPRNLPTMNTTPTNPPAMPTPPAFKADIPRRVVDLPAGAPKRPSLSGLDAGGAEMRKLIVGRDISLSGEIASCDMLVVEGTVEAKLRDGRTIEIAETGLFKGSVEIDEADIGGRFEGDITVRGTLKVRASGRITGTVRYGQLEVEQGGQLTGAIEVLTGTAKITPVAASGAAE